MELLPSGHQAPKLSLITFTFAWLNLMCTYPVQPCLHILLAVCTFLCTSLFILLFIKSTVYCSVHFISLHIIPLIFVSYFYFILTYIYIYSPVICCIFIFIFLHCPLSGPVLIYISLLIISCIIEYVMNKRTLKGFLHRHTFQFNYFWKDPHTVTKQVSTYLSDLEEQQNSLKYKHLP